MIAKSSYNESDRVAAITYGTYPEFFVYPFLPQYVEPSPSNLGIGRKSHADLNQPIKIVRKRNT